MLLAIAIRNSNTLLGWLDRVPIVALLEVLIVVGDVKDPGHRVELDMAVAVLEHLALPLVDRGHAKLAVAAGKTLPPSRRRPHIRSAACHRGVVILIEVVEDALVNADGLAHAPRVPQQGHEPVGQIQGLPVGAATRLAHVVVHGAAELDGLVHVRLPRVRLDQQRADAQHHRRRPVALHLAGLPERSRTRC
ncbi:hypothetical protein PG989_001035 [Apiospora arundinis]